ncbi:hypothetical protein BGZ96_001448 [Linnemannia gamsii]|uniref:Uncharacterized protein n=1 Tax=Linnemannia gamsii TaxID=64522 RepID=A0ABQ7KAJ5_9FUNG|nr:hypothetical protein BGZ96_001448 [Linnemannia gamsii]
MHFTSALALLSVAAVVSADQIRSNTNGLCLDVPDGVNGPNKIRLTDCCKAKHSNWTIVANPKNVNEVMIRHTEGITDNNNNGWCVDHYPDRTGPNPTLWECNYEFSQYFTRDPNTVLGADSFVKRNKLHELAVLPGDGANSLANFGPIEPATAKRVHFEWTIVK